MNRSLVGNFLILTFLVLTLSGGVMYFNAFQKNVAAIHTLFAMFFVLSVTFHIVNNKRPLKNYLTGKRSKHLAKYQGLILTVLLSLIVFAGYQNVAGINALYDWGNEWRNRQVGKEESSFDYQLIKVNESIASRPLAVEVKKGRAFKYPLFAIWLEDSAGNYIETLYISRVIASGVFDYGIKEGDVWKPSVKRRPEALPFWSHKRNILAEDGYYVPLTPAADLDGVSGATPTNNFIIQTKSESRVNQYRILMEVNQSYDWNEFYSEDKFPDDEIYSGSGQVGQPSMIYSSDLLDSDRSERYELLHLIGHGHHSGRDGKLYTDMSRITTAKEIVDLVLVKLR
ncbi:MAG: hypothetical protein R8N23_08315 [Reichenbachiella sp.]|uniref:hypothetical protein n=1 Tax=Reichenbachiella sp. TaxID=2184521 RepID=UPI002966C90A|nr:hypothetical protein [Reichenbachiella sp.]MDW3209857.1 hypothetical protein [Reichenbachiella sp.]